MATAGKKGIRLTFSPEELQEYYAYLGGKAGAIRDGAAIRDRRPSECSEELLAIRITQDRIELALREHQGHEIVALKVGTNGEQPNLPE